MIKYLLNNIYLIIKYILFNYIMNSITKLNYNQYNFDYNEIILKELLNNNNFDYDYCDNYIYVNNTYNLTLIEYIDKYGFLNYDQNLKFVKCICNQIMILKDFNLGMINLNMNDIIVLSDNAFIINININNLSIINNNVITINSPFKKHIFTSPEVNIITSLPNKIHYKNTLYSIALISLYCLNIDSNNISNKINNDFDKINFEFNKVNNSKVILPKIFNLNDIEYRMNYINETELFFILKRCLVEMPENRYFFLL